MISCCVTIIIARVKEGKKRIKQSKTDEGVYIYFRTFYPDERNLFHRTNLKSIWQGMRMVRLFLQLTYTQRISCNLINSHRPNLQLAMIRKYETLNKIFSLRLFHSMSNFIFL